MLYSAGITINQILRLSKKLPGARNMAWGKCENEGMKDVEKYEKYFVSQKIHMNMI